MVQAGNGNAECRVPNAEWKKGDKKFRIPHSEFRICHARSARPLLRKPVGASRKRAHPADAFCPQAPCPRATNQATRKCQTLIVSRQSRGFTSMKLISLHVISDLMVMAISPPPSPPPSRGRVRVGGICQFIYCVCINIQYPVSSIWYLVSDVDIIALPLR